MPTKATHPEGGIVSARSTLRYEGASVVATIPDVVARNCGVEPNQQVNTVITKNEHIIVEPEGSDIPGLRRTRKLRTVAGSVVLTVTAETRNLDLELGDEVKVSAAAGAGRFQIERTEE